jgi:hypothetical protein
MARDALRKVRDTRISCSGTSRAKLARIPAFSALADSLAGVHGELPRVLRDLRPVAGELRRVLVSFDDVERNLGSSERLDVSACFASGTKTFSKTSKPSSKSSPTPWYALKAHAPPALLAPNRASP